MDLPGSEVEKRMELSAKLTTWKEEIEALIPESNTDYVAWWPGSETYGHFGGRSSPVSSSRILVI